MSKIKLMGDFKTSFWGGAVMKSEILEKRVHLIYCVSWWRIDFFNFICSPYSLIVYDSLGFGAAATGVHNFFLASLIFRATVTQWAETRKKVHFGRTMQYCLPQRQKSTFFGIFSSGGSRIRKETMSEEKKILVFEVIVWPSPTNI